VAAAGWFSVLGGEGRRRGDTAQLRLGWHSQPNGLGTCLQRGKEDTSNAGA